MDAKTKSNGCKQCKKLKQLVVVEQTERSSVSKMHMQHCNQSCESKRRDGSHLLKPGFSFRVGTFMGVTVYPTQKLETVNMLIYGNANIRKCQYTVIVYVRNSLRRAQQQVKRTCVQLNVRKYGVTTYAAILLQTKLLWFV